MTPIQLPARGAPVARALVLTALLGAAACARTPLEQPAPEAKPPLRELADRRGIGFGTAADRTFKMVGPEGARFREVTAREFNVLTPENDLKHSRLRPARDVYDFSQADSLIAFAERNRMRVRGHTLVWHRQIAPWLTGGTWTREEVRAQLADHIARVVGRYRGRLVAWDVVNEAIADDATLRRTFWSEKLGREYIETAFRLAHAADPAVPLFYNDYGIEGLNAKSDSVYALVRDLKARGVPIHGIGFQAHFTVGRSPGRQALAENFARFAALGLKIHVTELDVRVASPTTSEGLQIQADRYRDVVEVCLENRACEMVVTWGVTDSDSWIPSSFPGWGDALLFDSAYRPKPAYWAVHRALGGG